MATTGVSRATENIVESRVGFRSQECSVAVIEVEYVDNPHTMVEDCVIPLFGKPGKLELQQYIRPDLAAVVKKHQD